MREPTEQITWQIEQILTAPPRGTERHGAPVLDPGPPPAAAFHGGSDGLIIPEHPLAGAEAFTLEARFKPWASLPDGTPAGAEQRFVHLQSDGLPDRLLLETRLTADGRHWYADTFICTAGREYPLNDPSLLHPLDAWHTMALVFDGERMHQYVNARHELSTTFPLTPPRPGRTSLGMRIDGTSPFAGLLAAVRFSSKALPSTDLWDGTAPAG